MATLKDSEINDLQLHEPPRDRGVKSYVNRQKVQLPKENREHEVTLLVDELGATIRSRSEV